MEDLKEIGYEGGKTTHGDVRRAINENVAAANRNFSDVSEAATKAQAGVTELREQLDEVSATATEAKNGVTELGQKVEGVSAVATEAQSGVTELRQQLGEVSDTATKAQTGVTELGEQLEGVSAVAQEALNTANSAKQTAATANSTAGAAKTAAEGAAADAATAKSDAATAKSDAATAKSTAEAAKSTAETASQTAATAKSTADTAKQTAEEAKASAEGLTGEVTGLGQRLDEVSADATGATDGLHQFMTLGILTEAPFPRATAEASGSFAAVGGDAPLKDGEIIPWTGWLTLVLCYQTTDSAAKVKLTGYAGQTLGKCELIGETAVAATEEPRVVRITGEHDYNPRRIGSPDACMAGSSYHVNVEVKSQNAGFTMLWAVVYESDEYGNPRRRGGSLRQYIETMQTKLAGINIETAKYNEKTGFHEANGLTDLSFNDMLKSANAGIVSLTNSSLYSTNSVRTNLVSAPYHTNSANSQFFQSFQCYGNNSMEVFVMYGYGSSNINLNIRDYGFSGNKLRAILATIRIYGKYPITNTPNLESAYIISDSDIKLASTEVFSYDSLNYSITRSINSGKAITITVSPAIYTKLTGSTVENWGDLKTKAEGKGVQLVSKGDANYPFLTEVIWHSYAALDRKIDAAASGDYIYIHTQDKKKIDSKQQDNWGTLVTLAAEKNITFAQAE